MKKDKELLYAERRLADFLPLHGTDYIEFSVGNAIQAAHYYMSAFGFQAKAYAGPETGKADKLWKRKFQTLFEAIEREQAARGNL